MATFQSRPMHLVLKEPRERDIWRQRGRGLMWMRTGIIWVVCLERRWGLGEVKRQAHQANTTLPKSTMPRLTPSRLSRGSPRKRLRVSRYGVLMRRKANNGNFSISRLLLITTSSRYLRSTLELSTSIQFNQYRGAWRWSRNMLLVMILFPLVFNNYA